MIFFCLDIPINEFIGISKQKNIEMGGDIIQKIESSIGDIFDNIQFYDNNEKYINIFSNKENYNKFIYYIKIIFNKRKIYF